MDEFHLAALQLTAMTAITISEEEQEDLSSCTYNIFLIPCPQCVRALTLAFALHTEMPQKSFGRRYIGTLNSTCVSATAGFLQQNWP